MEIESTDKFIEFFEEAELFAFDLDGTTIMGSKPIEGVKDFLTFLENQGKEFCFLTNNSSKTNSMHADSLSKIFGFHVPISRVSSSLDALEFFLKENRVKRIYPFLNEKVKDHLGNFFEFDDENPEFIVVGFNTDASYSQLIKVSQLIFKGIPYLLVHPDLRCPTDFGYIPDAGSFAKVFEITTDKKPIWVGGKPNPVMVKTLMKRFDVAEEGIIYVGDRLYTDVEMVRQTKIRGILVLTGETSLQDYKKYVSHFELDRVLVFENMKEMLKVIS